MNDRNMELQHGGNIYDKEVRYDLSVNINPAGMPDIINDAIRRGEERIGCYPEYGAEGLRKAIGECHGMDPECVVCGNGASEIISVLGRMYEGESVMIPVPSFVGYERAFAGSDVKFVLLDKDRDFVMDDSIAGMIESDHPAAVVTGNPNNPTGRLADRGVLMHLADVCRKSGCRLVIDESFIELSDGGEDNSLVDAARDNDHIIIIRSVTKAFAVPGVRLGYMMCADRDLCRRVRGLLPEWNISVFAEEVGKEIFTWSGRDEYLRRSEETVRVHRNRMAEKMAVKGIRYIESSCNFVLFESDAGLYERMLRHGLLIRRCTDYRGLEGNWFRVAVSAGSACIVFLRSL